MPLYPIAPKLLGELTRSASITWSRREYGLSGVGFCRVIRTKQSPFINHDFSTSCCRLLKLFIPMASQFCFSSAHRANSASTCSCHARAFSTERPSTRLFTVLFSESPIPTTFVRLVLMAAVATGEFMYSIRARWRRVALLWLMSSFGLPLLGTKPRSALLVRLAPPSLYPLAWGRAVSGRNSPVFLSRYLSPTSYVLHKKRTAQRRKEQQTPPGHPWQSPFGLVPISFS